MEAERTPTPAMSPKAERQGINVQNERSLHMGLKAWYAQPLDRLEVPVRGYVVDLVRGRQLVEFQTRNFAAIKPKLKALLPHHPVHLVHPITVAKIVTQVDITGTVQLSRRKSPFTGALTDLFEELVRIPELVGHPHLTLEFVLIKEEEVRCRDGKGSKHRKRVSLRDRKLLDVISTHPFSSPQDFLQFLPSALPQPFSNKDLQTALQLPLHRCRQITYCLRKMEALTLTGKKGNELLFQVAPCTSILTSEEDLPYSANHLVSYT